MLCITQHIAISHRMQEIHIFVDLEVELFGRCVSFLQSSRFANSQLKRVHVSCNMQLHSFHRVILDRDECLSLCGS